MATTTVEKEPKQQRAGINLEALRFWQAVQSQTILNNDHDLTTRQMAILLTVYLDPPPHSVKSLAERFVISKAAVCRALDTLSTLGFVKRKRDENDKRMVYIQRTVKGSVHLSEFSHTIMQSTQALQKKVA